MSFILCTTDGYIESGFRGPDSATVCLGELPPITTQQYVGFAAMALTETVIPGQERDRLIDWLDSAQQVYDSLEGTALRPSTDRFFGLSVEAILEFQQQTYDQDDIIESQAALFSTMAPQSPDFYKRNPVLPQTDGAWVGLRGHEGDVQYVVDAHEFFNFTCYINHGGFFGWGSMGTFPEVENAAAQILQSLITETSA